MYGRNISTKNLRILKIMLKCLCRILVKVNSTNNLIVSKVKSLTDSTTSTEQIQYGILLSSHHSAIFEALNNSPTSTSSTRAMSSNVSIPG